MCIYVLNRGADSHPPGGFLDLLNKNIPVHAQGGSDGSSFKPIHVGDDTNIADCGRTHVLWTKDEDCRLVSYTFFRGKLLFLLIQ